jgi:hypothetical protein
MTFTPHDGPKQRKQVTRSGANPRAYMGVMPESPTNYVTFDKDPTTKDFRNWEVGDEWENRTTKDVWKLVEKGRGTGGTEGYGTWIKIANGLGNLSSLKDDTGTVITGDTTGSVSVKGGEMLNATASANTVTLDFQRALLNGQIPIGSMVGPTKYANITAGANVTVTNSPNGITISSAAGAGGEIQITGDSGTTATSVGNVVKVVGTAGHITSTGDMADKVTLDIGADVALKADVADTFVTDAGNATVALGEIDILGGQNINTSGAGNTVTVNVNDTYQVPVAAGTLEIGTVDATQLLGSISIADLKTLLGLP